MRGIYGALTKKYLMCAEKEFRIQLLSACIQCQVLHLKCTCRFLRFKILKFNLFGGSVERFSFSNAIASSPVLTYLPSCTISSGTNNTIRIQYNLCKTATLKKTKKSTSLVIPIGDPRDGFFYPTLTLLMHSDRLSHPYNW